MNHAVKATAHKTKIRRWTTFTPPQSAAPRRSVAYFYSGAHSFVMFSFWGGETRERRNYQNCPIRNRLDLYRIRTTQASEEGHRVKA
jgi:hypothetical protein